MDSVAPLSPSPSPRRPAIDLLIAAIFAISAFTYAYAVGRWSVSLYFHHNARDCWFDADPDSCFPTETDFRAEHNRTIIHPLYPYLAYPPVFAVRKALNVSGEEACRVVHAALSAAWLGAFFVLLRRAAFDRLAATAFSLVAGTSATSLFWMPFVEKWTLGALSFLPALWLAARPEPARARAHFLAAVSSISITLTNWMISVFLALKRLSLRAAIAVLAGSAFVGIGLNALQNWIFPQVYSAGDVIGGNSLPWLFQIESGGPFAVLRTFFFSSILAPEIRWVLNYRQENWPSMTFQFGGIGSASTWGSVGALAWAALMVLGGIGLWKRRRDGALPTVLTLTLLYQVLLHLIYGRETFLYAFHFMPLLVIGAAYGTRLNARPVVLGLAFVVAACAVANNAPVFAWAKAYSNRHDAIKAVQAETERHRKYPPLMSNPIAVYRFTRDILGRGEPFPQGFDMQPDIKARWHAKWDGWKPGDPSPILSEPGNAQEPETAPKK